MADRMPPRPPKASWGNVSKNLALWVLAGLLGLALFQLMNSQRTSAHDISYTQFSEQLDGANVAAVEIFDGKYLEGEFKQPIPVAGRSVKAFKVLLPVADSEEFVKRLEAAGVRIKALSITGLFISEPGVSCPAVPGSKHAVITGTAEVSGPLGTDDEDFTVQVDDCDEPGTMDTLGIDTETYHNPPSQLIGGNIKIH